MSDPVPLPKALRSLPKDRRGYPIPYIVMLDKEGKPHFTINDHRRVHTCFTQRKCSICGRRIADQFWFIGGPGSFFHPNGAFIDPPTHEECGRYALQTCPYLALPSYGKRIDDRTLKPGLLPDDRMILMDPTMDPNRPQTFCFGSTRSYDVAFKGPGERYLHAHGWTHYEFWRNGQPLSLDQGEAIVANLGLTLPTQKAA
jgi:hypothetical protein